MSRNVLITEVAEGDLDNLGFDDTQKVHTLEIALRLEDFDDPEQMVDLDIRKMSHFYEVRRLLDEGGPLRSEKVQLRFGVVEKDNGDIVILQITNNHEAPDVIETVLLEDRYVSYLRTGAATLLNE